MREGREKMTRKDREVAVGGHGKEVLSWEEKCSHAFFLGGYLRQFVFGNIVFLTLSSKRLLHLHKPNVYLTLVYSGKAFFFSPLYSFILIFLLDSFFVRTTFFLFKRLVSLYYESNSNGVLSKSFWIWRTKYYYIIYGKIYLNKKYFIGEFYVGMTK